MMPNGYVTLRYKLIEKIGEAQAVIPPKRNRKTQRHYDKHLYKRGI